MIDQVTIDKRARDRDDLQNEIAGRETGRQKRFLPTGYEHPSSEKARDAEAQVMRVMTALQRMMQNEDYAALYTRVHNTVSRMEMAVDAELDKARERHAETSEQLEALRARAGTLADGTRVYRSETGEVFKEDGTALKAGEEEDVTWGDQPPSWEEYRTAKERADAAQADVQEIETYQREVLQPARDELGDPNNEDNPLAADEMEQIERDVLEQAPASVLNSMEEPPTATDTVTAPNLEQLAKPAL